MRADPGRVRDSVRLAHTDRADPDVFTFSIPTTFKTVMDIPVTVPGIGDCLLAIDTTLGAATAIDITGEVTFSTDRLRMGLQALT